MFDSIKKQRRGKITRQKILKTALKLFSDKGYDKVTVDEIVKKSGTSKGSFYQHFPAKSDIFLARFSEADDYYEKVIQSLPKEMDPLDKLFIFTQKLMQYLDGIMGKDLMKVIYSSAIESKEHTYFSNPNRSLFKIIRSILHEAFERQVIKNEQKLDDISTMVVQSMMGIIYHWGVHDSEKSLESLSLPLTKTLIAGIRVMNE